MKVGGASVGGACGAVDIVCLSHKVLDVMGVLEKVEPAQFGGEGCTEQARRGRASRGDMAAGPTETERLNVNVTGVPAREVICADRLSRSTEGVWVDCANEVLSLMGNMGTGVGALETSGLGARDTHSTLLNVLVESPARALAGDTTFA